MNEKQIKVMLGIVKIFLFLSIISGLLIIFLFWKKLRQYAFLIVLLQMS